MTAPVVARELIITYGAYVCGVAQECQITEYHALYQGFSQSGVRFTVVVSGASEAAFAANCIAIEAAFRTPRKNLSVVLGATTLLSLSHSAGTGFNADPTIEKAGAVGDTGRSRSYTIKIDFGMPADNTSTAFRRDSTVRVTWSADRRRHVAIDGIYTCNGSTASSAQYAAAIGAYASAILTALGGSYDLLEENVENDDQDKVATFHRLYDEQIVDRNEATITLFYGMDRRRHVTISGKYTNAEVGSGATAIYEADIAAFVSAVLGAIGGTYDLQGETREANDTDTVVNFSRVYDELVSGRKDASYSVAYDGARIRTVTFQATYTTVTAGGSANSAASSGGASWAASILTANGITVSDKLSETITPNDQDNMATFQAVFREVIYSEAGSLPDAEIVNQQLSITRTKEAPGDTPQAARLVTLAVEYSCELDKTMTVDLQGKWSGDIRTWLVGSVLPTFQAGIMAVVHESPSFDFPNNRIKASMELWIATANILLNKVTVNDDVDQGVEMVGLWTGNPMDFYVFQGHIAAVRTITKIYRRVAGAGVPVGADGNTPSGPTPIAPPAGQGGSLTDPTAPGISGSTGEGGDDPFGFGGFKAIVIRRSQPEKTKLTIGLPGNQLQVEDIQYVTVVRVYSEPAGSSNTPTQ